MNSIIEIIFSVFVYVIIGYIIRKINIIPNRLIKGFDFISFNILLPIALVAYFWKIQFPTINTFHLMLSFFGSGVLVFTIGFYISAKFLKFKPDDSALFGLGSCFCNSVAPKLVIHEQSAFAVSLVQVRSINALSSIFIGSSCSL